MRYKAWGETRYAWGTASTTFRFTGQRREGDLGLYFYGSRWYDPALGRFIQPDTIVPAAGNPLAFDRYSYVYNSPLKYTDPAGHQGEPTWWEKLKQKANELGNRAREWWYRHNPCRQKSSSAGQRRRTVNLDPHDHSWKHIWTGSRDAPPDEKWKWDPATWAQVYNQIWRGELDELICPVCHEERAYFKYLAVYKTGVEEEVQIHGDLYVGCGQCGIQLRDRAILPEWIRNPEWEPAAERLRRGTEAN